MTQRTLFPHKKVLDAPEGRRRRDQGITRARKNPANAKPLSTAQLATEQCAHRLSEFTSDDVHVLCEQMGDPLPKGTNMGSVFKWAESRGLITWRGGSANSKRPTRQAGMLKKWVSLVYKGAS